MQSLSSLSKEVGFFQPRVDNDGTDASLNCEDYLIS